MAQAKKTAAETADVKKMAAVETADIQAVEKAPEKKKPVVEPGAHFKKVQIKAKGLICASYGTFNAGDTGMVPYSDAKELEESGLCEIVGE